MSGELEAITPAALADIPQHTASQGAMDMLREQFEALEMAHKYAQVLCASDLVPTIYRNKVDNGTVAILYGLELGLPPQAALQQVIVIQGKPTVYARTMVAIVKARGYSIRTIEASDESVTVVGVSPSGDQEQSTWTIERAKKAGYFSNKKYETNPEEMLYAKAAAEVCRRLAPEILLGISYSVEDMQNAAPIKVATERVYSRPSARDVLDAEPEPKISRDARKKLTDAMLAAGVGKKLDEARAWMSDVLGRDVISTEQLTKADEAALYAELASASEPADENPDQLTIGE